MQIFLKEVPGKLKRDDHILFSESNSRFIIEVPKKNQKAFEKTMKGKPLGLIGCVSEDSNFKVFGLDSKVCLEEDIEELKESWQKPLKW